MFPFRASTLFLALALLAACTATRSAVDSTATAPSGKTASSGSAATAVSVTQPPAAIGIIVPDLAAARRFYVDLLGFEEAGGFKIDSVFGRRSGLSAGVPFSVSLVQPKGGDGSFQLKLVEFAEPPAPVSGNDVVQARLGMQYLTLFVDDIAGILARLKAAGVPTAAETPLQLGDGRTFALVRDPSGVFVEIIERKQ